MKIDILSIADGRGGGAIGAMRMHKGLLSAGIDSVMDVMYKHSEELTVSGPADLFTKILVPLRPHLDSLPVRLYNNRSGFIFSPAMVPDSTNRKIQKRNPDIVHLRWICAGMIKIESLKKYNRPIVWTLSDSWAFTGGCHLPFDCERYKDSCGKCPTLGSVKENDLSRKVWKRKKKAWDTLDITVVTGSKWLAQCAKESSLFKDKRIEVIPNGLDLNVFKPSDRDSARDEFSLPKDKKLVLFGAISSTSDRNKGFHLLAPALKKLSDEKFKEDIELVVFGSEKPKEDINFGFKINYAGSIYDESKIAKLYSAVDIFVLPSLQENLPYTVMEAMACATPVVGFNVGGVPDMVEHKKSGYLATPNSSDDLEAGMRWALEDNKRLAELSNEALKKVESDFYAEKQAKSYKKLYESILNKN